MTGKGWNDYTFKFDVDYEFMVVFGRYNSIEDNDALNVESPYGRTYVNPLNRTGIIDDDDPGVFSVPAVQQLSLIFCHLSVQLKLLLFINIKSVITDELFSIPKGEEQDSFL